MSRGRVPLAWLLCGVVSLTSGCAAWPRKNVDVKADSADTAGKADADAKSDEGTSWTESWRERSGNIKGFGLDSRAKEIERNLGVY